MTRRSAAVALATVLALVAAACSGDGDGATPSTIDPSEVTSSSATEEPVGELPPAKPLDLEPIYGEALAELGLRLVDRGGTIDLSGGGYVASPTGRHLALYVEPIAGRSTEEYIDGIRDVAVVFSDVFDRWPGLESYDVCQEPLDPDGTQGEEPLPVTQIVLTRAESDAIDWDGVSTVELVRRSLAEPPELVLRVGAELAEEPAYAAVVEEAVGSG